MNRETEPVLSSFFISKSSTTVCEHFITHCSGEQNKWINIRILLQDTCSSSDRILEFNDLFRRTESFTRQHRFHLCYLRSMCSTSWIQFVCISWTWCNIVEIVLALIIIMDEVRTELRQVHFGYHRYFDYYFALIEYTSNDEKWNRDVKLEVWRIESVFSFTCTIGQLIKINHTTYNRIRSSRFAGSSDSWTKYVKIT